MNKYIPKGNMCTNCKRRHKDCTDLMFHKMKVIESNAHNITVICDKFERVDK